MASNKKRAASGLTIGVWLAAFSLAAVLAYDLKRPLRGRHSSFTPAVTALPTGAGDGPDPSVLYMAPITIVGTRPYPGPAAPFATRPEM